MRFRFIKIYLLLIALSGLELFAQDNILPVIPQPKEYHFTNDKYDLSGSSIQIKHFGANSEQVEVSVVELSAAFRQVKNILSGKEIKSTKQILTGLPSESREFNQICKKYNLLPEEKLGEEGYKLIITNDKIIITANNQKGIFYGIQTLIQIIRGTQEKFLTGIKITDWPSMKYRAVMDDISRGPVPTIDYMKYQIRRLAEMKINVFTPYIEHVVKTKSHPEFAPDGGSLSIEEWKSLSNYASKFNIMLAGSFQSFGHFGNIIKTRKYGHLGESGTLISPTLPESYEFLKDIYTEMIPAFSAPFFNINCDETFDLGKGASKKLVDSLGYARVYYEHIMKIYKIIKHLNKKILMWGDVLLEYPELLKILPKDIIIATWTYDDNDSYVKFIEPIKNAGFQFFVAPGVLNSSKLFPFYKQVFGNIKGFTKAAEEYGALGVINTVWDDGGNAFFSNDWYGVSYGADKSWNLRSKDSTNFDLRFNNGIYGTQDCSYTQSAWKIVELADLGSTDGLNDKVLFENLLPDSTENIKVSLNEWDKVLSITKEAREIISKSELKNYPYDKKYLSFVCNLYETLASERFNLIRAVGLYKYADSVFAVNKTASRKSIAEAVDLLNSIIEKEISLKNDYRILWLAENQTYWLDSITTKYQKKIDSFLDVKTRLIASLKNLDEGLPILTKEKVRLNITLLHGKYFREWLTVSPLPNKDGMNISNTDYLVEMGGELKATPRVTQEFNFDSAKYRWTRIVSRDQDVNNLKDIFHGVKGKAVTYLYVTIDTPKDTVITSLTGCEGGIEVIVNGKSVYKNESAHKLIPDQYYFPITLHKGINNLMLKITRINDNWGFTFRLRDCEVRNRKNRYRIVSE